MLESQEGRRYHAGLPPRRRSTLADAVATRPPEVFTCVLAVLIGRLTRQLPRGVKDCVRLIDSTTVALSGRSAGWARFSAKMCGAKAHVVYDPDATYVFDLGYYDYAWWGQLDAQACRIVTRLKANTPLRVVETLPLPAGAPAIVSDRIGFLPARLAARDRGCADRLRADQAGARTSRHNPEPDPVRPANPRQYPAPHATGNTEARQ